MAMTVPLAALPIPMLVLEPGDDPRICEANSAFEAMVQLEVNAIPRLSSWLERTYPNPVYRQRTLDLWRQAAQQARSGGTGQLQCRVQGAGADPLEVLVQITAHEGLLLASITDVTVRRRAEAALEEARATQAATALAITEAIPVGTYTMVMEPDKTVAYFAFMSERFLQITGLDRTRARENPLEGFACVHPDDYDDWLRINAEAFASKQPFKGECRIVVDDQTRWITAESVPRDRPDGSTVWEGVLIDVTDRVLAQQALQASQARLLRLLDNLPIPLACLGIGARADEVFCNRRFSETYGYSAADLQDQGQWMARAYPDPEQRRLVQARLEQSLDTAAGDDTLVTAGEFRFSCADGRERDVLISATRVDDLVVASILDITDRKDSERELGLARERERRLEEQQRQRLEQKLRMSLSAAAVVHEIDQPLAAVVLQSQLALQRLRACEASSATLALDQPLQALVEEAQRAVTMMHGMRSLLRNVRSEVRPLDLARVVDGALLALQHRFESSGVQLECHGLNQPCPLQGDAEQLQVAIGNLLRNALEALASRPGGEQPKRIAVLLQHQPRQVVLRIGDSGPGLSAAVLKALPLQSTKPEGTGIGLYLVQTAMENHQGRLEFGRSPLGGAEVSLQLPRTPDSESSS